MDVKYTVYLTIYFENVGSPFFCKILFSNSVHRRLSIIRLFLKYFAKLTESYYI